MRGRNFGRDLRFRLKGERWVGRSGQGAMLMGEGGMSLMISKRIVFIIIIIVRTLTVSDFVP